MNPVMTVLQMPIVERLGWALLHFLWQGVLIGGILLLAQRLLRGKSPAILYGVMVLGLAACVVAPVVTLIVLPAGEHHAVVQPDAWRPPVFIEQAMPPAEFHPSAPNRNVEPQATPPARRRAKAPSHVQALRAQCLARYNRTMIVLEPWTPRVAIAWCLGVIVLGARMWAGWWTTRRWIGTSASLAEPAWAKPFAVLCRKMSVDIPIRLLASAAVSSPVVIGWLRPAILVPVQLVTGIPPEHIEAILAHELAHIRRHDYLVNFLQMLVETILFYHPVVWWIGRRMRQLREECCDELALATVADRAVYARALNRLEERRAERLTAVLAARGGALLRRIRRIAGEAEQASCGTECLAAGSGALLTVVLLAVLALHAVGDPAAKADEEKILAVLPPPQGVVVDPAGAPVSGARVLLYHHKSAWGLGNAIVEETTSAADGSFALHAQLDFTSRREDFQGDHYILAAAHPGFAPGWSVIYGRQTATPRFRLTLTPPETRVFQVKDKTGKPLADASVWISAMGDRADSNAVLRAYAGLTEDIGLVSGLSDESGTVRLANVPATSCGFHASKTGFATTWAGYGREKGWDITLSPAACVEGTVVDPQGRPVTNLVIWANATWPLWQFWTASTDTNGRFRFGTLYGKGGSWDGDGGTGEYELTLRRDERYTIKPIPVKVEMGQHVDVGQVRLETTPRCLLHGRLLDPATKSPLADVTLLCNAGNDRRRIETAADGTFSLRVPYGKVDIEWENEQWDWCTLNVEHSYEPLYQGVAFAPTLDVTFYANGVVQRLTAISGRAVLPDGKPAGNVTLAIVGMSTSMTWTANWHGRGSLPFKTEPDGSFRCAAVPCGIPLQLCAVSDDAACTAIVKLPPLDPRGCDQGNLKLQPATPRRFRIVDELGNPWRNRKLRLTLATLVSTSADIGRFGRTLTTDGQGVTCMDAALPGVPYLLKLEKSELYSREVDFAELVEKNGVPPDLTLTVSSRVPEDTPLAVRVAGPKNRTIEPAEFPDFEAKTKDGWWKNGALKIDKRLEDGRCSIVRKTLCVLKPGAPIHVLVVAKDGQKFVAAGIIPSGTNELVLQAQDLPPPMDVANDDMPGVAPGQIAGRVVNEAGKPVPGAVVSLQPPRDMEERAVTSDAAGIFRFDEKQVGFGAVYVQVDADGYARRWISRFPKGQGFRVPLGTTTRFAGRLTASDGKPVGTVAIQLLTSLPRAGASLNPQTIDNIPLNVTTKEDGSYDFPVQPGTYKLQATNSLGLVASAEGVTIRDGTVTALPLQLRPGARVKLQAVDCITGAPVVGVPISIMEYSSLRGLWTKPGSQRVTDKDGVAEWDGLLPGKIELSCDRMVVFGYPVPEGQTPYQRWWSTSDACRASLPVDGDYVRNPPQLSGGAGELYIDVRDNLPTAIVQMERGFRVKGRVTSRTGALPENLAVSLVAEGSGIFSGDARYILSVAKDGTFDGYFPAGNGVRYSLCVSQPGKRSSTCANAVTELFDSRPGDVLEFALTLPLGGYVTGRIFDPLGQPVGGVSVRADAKDRRDTVYTWPQTTSDTNGVFLLGPIRPVSYNIVPYPARDYCQRWEDATRTANVSDGCTNALGDIKLSQEEVGAARRRK